jgi:hypothetical protein
VERTRHIVLCDGQSLFYISPEFCSALLNQSKVPIGVPTDILQDLESGSQYSQTGARSWRSSEAPRAESTIRPNTPEAYCYVLVYETNILTDPPCRYVADGNWRREILYENKFIKVQGLDGFC